MAKVTYTALKGLVQSLGSGFNVNSITTVAAASNLDSSTFLTVVTAEVDTSGAGLVLPASADTGAVKIIISTTADDALVKATNTSLGGDLTLTNKGDLVFCVYDGSKWQIGRSQG